MARFGLVEAYAYDALAVPTSRAYTEPKDFDAVASELGLAEERLREIAQQTVNRAATRTKTRIARAVRTEVRLPYSYALGKVYIRRAFLKRGANEAKVSAERKGLLLTRYNARPEKKGVSVQVGADSARKTMLGAFFIKLKNGAQGIAIRKKGDKRRYNVLHGPSPSQIFDFFRPQIMAEINEWTIAELNRRVLVELSDKGSVGSKIGRGRIYDATGDDAIEPGP